MIHQTQPPSFPRSNAAAPPRALARDARGRRARACVTLACVGALCAGAAAAKKPKPPKAASTPSTAQILAPSLATVPDRLPAEQRVWRCGNSYSAHPCADAGVKPLDIADARSDEQRHQSDELLARDKRLAAWYEAQRRERDGSGSAPTASRRASAVVECTSTTTMACVPKKPRSRTVSVPGAGTASTAKPKS